MPHNKFVSVRRTNKYEGGKHKMYLKDENVRKEVLTTCLFYGLNFKETPTGIIVTNSVGDIFLLRFTKNSRRVRKILHLNHGKGLKITLFDPDNFTRETIKELFHPQEVYDAEGNKETDVRKILTYIHRHGSKREKLNLFRNITMTALKAYC